MRKRYGFRRVSMRGRGRYRARFRSRGRRGRGRHKGSSRRLMPIGYRM